MTVSTTDNKAFFTGNGVTTSFDFTFKYFNESDIKVLLDGVLDDTYTLTPNPSGDGGTISYITAPTTAVDGGLIYRELPFTQGTRIPTSDKIPRGTLENAFDRVTILTQQLQEQVSRSLLLPISFNNSDQLVLPEPQAGRALVWRNDLLGLDNTSVNLETVLADCTAQASAAAASAAASSASAASAASSLSSANTAVTTAQTYRDNAYNWANAAVDTPVNDGTHTGRSAYHWSVQAQGMSVPMSNKGELFGRGTSANVAVPAPTQDNLVLTSQSSTPSGLAWGYGIPTGVSFGTYDTVAPPGFVLAAGKTIGSATSGATERANADTQNLYVVLWNAIGDSICTVTGGRGANALADFNANKPLKLPDRRGKGEIGLDNMGGTAANVVTAASFGGSNATTLGGSGGEETHALTGAENGPHSHTLGSHSFNLVTGTGIPAIEPGGTTYTTNSSGSGTPHNNMGPWEAKNIIIKL